MRLLLLVAATAAMLTGGIIQATNWGDTVGSALLVVGFALFVVDRLLTLAWPENDTPSD